MDSSLQRGVGLLSTLGVLRLKERKDGKNEYKAWIRQEMQRDANMINPITDLANIINDALNGGVEN